MSDNVLFDPRISPDTRLLYEIFRQEADDDGLVRMTTIEMGKYLGLSRWPVSTRILPEMEQHGLIAREDHGNRITVTRLLERSDDAD